MLFAKRNNDGTIISISNTPSEVNEEAISESELANFLSASSGPESFDRLLALLDAGTIRVLEDLINLLVKKNIIMFTELPIEAQEKLGERLLIREQLQNNNPMIADDIF